MHQDLAKMREKFKKADFDQLLECAAPKRLSKYTKSNLPVKQKDLQVSNLGKASEVLGRGHDGPS